MSVSASPGVRDYETVVVAYRSAALVEELIDELGPQFPIIVVDNCQGADGLAERVADRPSVRVMDGPGRGFAVGANLGLRETTRDVVMLVGPDSRPTPELLDELAAEIRADSACVQALPMAIGRDGRVELGTAGWEPTWWRALSHASGLHYLLPRTGLWARPEPGSEADVDWVSASVCALDRSLFFELGAFDEGFFVYNEDVDLSRRIRSAGLGQRLRTDLLVPHGSGGSGDAPARMSQLRGSSMMRDVGRHHSRLETLAIRLILSAGAGSRALAYRALRRPAKARWHEAYVRGLWVGPPDMS
ncbi:glycosyltransferase [Actinomycetospora termitidis]|uniref:Glycosyltransferase n=1 Tax=Actinomycetospora termitidis TaxID=3053470 RepID=A0ABT7ME70_9PSEU|nr:glycosyltransferase [Actinomycetospora sp. Odt1-22]MDL5158962.1 glycosyltransferase [Actinomycetospora sp. Odt1-22]